ncbi:glycosyltransferase family 2 protein [Geomonas nitrogeniifigens]|uniref:dolichyl-phosphate beta-glucosyltransferase n=1 Tax=Geomonas diazotrophica TaxID=2843197 RepID=A0ABX8JUL5_9BACT|nr:dolichyl-phosphate beta-glucosyltransferase [Geomonas nitrogeniifigens]QWV99105.1 glycosyltransferase family 2 protein [Geomonas nitrogeniifigens]
MRKTRIVVPCYNESQRLLPQAFLSALHTDPSLSFLFVNDGSTDGTLQVLNSIRDENPAQVEVIDLESNCGKAEAVRRGMLEASAGAFDYVGYWDADLATPLDAIAEFCAVLEKRQVDAVLGSRVRLLGRSIKRRLLRHYLGRIFATCASLLLGMNVYDTQCGAKIFRNSTALQIVFSSPFKVSWIFDVEMLARFPLVLESSSSEVSANWVEFPLQEWRDVKGSKVCGADYLKAVAEFGTLFYYLKTPASKAYKRYLHGWGRRPIDSRT